MYFQKARRKNLAAFKAGYTLELCGKMFMLQLHIRSIKSESPGMKEDISTFWKLSR
jgi:hypothetical protein